MKNQHNKLMEDALKILYLKFASKFLSASLNLLHIDSVLRILSIINYYHLTIETICSNHIQNLNESPNTPIHPICKVLSKLYLIEAHRHRMSMRIFKGI